MGGVGKDFQPERKPDTRRSRLPRWAAQLRAASPSYSDSCWMPVVVGEIPVSEICH